MKGQTESNENLPNVFSLLAGCHGAVSFWSNRVMHAMWAWLESQLPMFGCPEQRDWMWFDFVLFAQGCSCLCQLRCVRSDCLFLSASHIDVIFDDFWWVLRLCTAANFRLPLEEQEDHLRRRSSWALQILWRTFKQ